MKLYRILKIIHFSSKISLYILIFKKLNENLERKILLYYYELGNLELDIIF